MLLPFLVICISSALSLMQVVADENVAREMFLDAAETYHLRWEVDFVSERVTFNATVRTTGFVGLGISPNPNMVGADIVIGGITPDGQTYFNDYHAPRNGLPSLDSLQNWDLISGTEQNGVTTLQFSRLLVTFDDEGDADIKDDTQYLIWALGEDDTVRYHGRDPARRGPISINLLDPAPDPTVTDATVTDPTGTHPTGSDATGTDSTGNDATGSEPTATEQNGSTRMISGSKLLLPGLIFVFISFLF